MKPLSLAFRPVSDAALCKVSQELGIMLTPAQAHMLLAHQMETLEHLGRVDFSGGILPKLMRAFSASPYILAEDWTQTLAQLIETFYFFKSETGDALPDDDLLAAMACLLNGRCGGSIDMLNDCTAEDLFNACADEERSAYDD